jgi:RecA-family ATPase
MKPWLRESQLTVIYGAYGSGKSLLSLLIAYVLGLKDYESESSVVGPFEVKHPTGSLYIDGEMGEEEMESRISKFEWIGQQQGRYRLRVFSIPEYQLATEDTFALSERKNQLKIIDWLRMHPDYKLVILDNVTTLFGLTDENSNSEWGTKINPLLRDLRAMNVACILLHHAGKDNKRGLRGASAIGAMANNVFRLTNHDSKNVDAGEAWFTLSKDKQRSGGFSFRTFSLHFTQTNDEHETHWNITDNF